MIQGGPTLLLARNITFSYCVLWTSDSAKLLSMLFRTIRDVNCTNPVTRGFMLVCCWWGNTVKVLRSIVSSRWTKTIRQIHGSNKGTEGLGIQIIFPISPRIWVVLMFTRLCSSHLQVKTSSHKSSFPHLVQRRQQQTRQDNSLKQVTHKTRILRQVPIYSCCCKKNKRLALALRLRTDLKIQSVFTSIHSINHDIITTGIMICDHSWFILDLQWIA